MTPMTAIMTPGTTKDRPQADETQTPAMSDPKMLPTEVCEFQMPMINPLLVGWWDRAGVGGARDQQGPGPGLGVAGQSTHFPFPNQFPTQATTAGQPVVCTSPLHTWQETGSVTAAPRGGGGPRSANSIKKTLALG